eukprot:TRINITY_DN90955_c0_g1_i1.p1 TRINITY_DN90955_c0_g1~~TRINITY_DN90955_c0_g1_i1.p1  ORF type:complete len:847 (-),score=215.52 TRINITY_DN90955_c0_g1_i1:170-2710(-)
MTEGGNDPERSEEHMAEEEGEDAEGDPQEIFAEDMERMQHVLVSIFEYYSVQAGRLQEPWLTSARFMRMALDAQLLDRRLTSAKMDLIFSRVCGSSPHMSQRQFLDGIVRIAVTKFPECSSKPDAIARLFAKHLASFAGASEGALADLNDDALALVAAADEYLRIMYMGYFEAELKPIPTNKRHSPSSVLGEMQQMWLKMLNNFEVVPDLLAKSTAFAVFREVSSVSDLPLRVREALCGVKPEGHTFTYMRFQSAIALLAQKCFADDGPVAVLRLFEWMDASKGRNVFVATYPGRASKSGATNFRIMPERLPEECLAKIPPELAQRRRPSASSISINKEALDALGAQSGRAMSSTSGAHLADGRRGSGSSSETGTLGEGSAAGRPLASWAKRLIHSTFGHYAALGDPMQRNSLSMQKWTRLLRDAGVLSSEAGWISQSPGKTPARFSPPARGGGSAFGRTKSTGSIPVSSSSPATARGAQRRHSSTGATARRPSTGGVSVGRSSPVTFAVSPSRSPSGGYSSATGPALLPLKVFQKPILSQVDADLIFVQVVRDAEKAAAPTRSSGCFGASPCLASSSAAGRGSPGSSAAARGKKTMTPAGFAWALAEIALRCMPEFSDRRQALEAFCSKVLEPLSSCLLEVTPQEVADAASSVEEPFVKKLLLGCQGGLDKIFNMYCTEQVISRHHWTADSMSKFGHDFELTIEVPHLTLQMIFRSCTQQEAPRGKGTEGQLRQADFVVALVLIAQRITGSQGLPLVDRLCHLFARLNAVAGSSNLAAKLGGGLHEPLLPVFGSQQRPASSAAASAASLGSLVVTGKAADKGGPRGGGHREAPDMSWASILESAK